MPPPITRRGRSSVGRAPRSQCGGQGFESPRLHQPRPKSEDIQAFLSNQHLSLGRWYPRLVRKGYGNRDSVWCYRRRVPDHLVESCGRAFVQHSLKTRDKRVAKKRREVEDLNWSARFEALEDRGSIRRPVVLCDDRVGLRDEVLRKASHRHESASPASTRATPASGDDRSHRLLAIWAPTVSSIPDLSADRSG